MPAFVPKSAALGSPYPDEPFSVGSVAGTSTRMLQVLHSTSGHIDRHLQTPSNCTWAGHCKVISSADWQIRRSQRRRRCQQPSRRAGRGRSRRRTSASTCLMMTRMQQQQPPQVGIDFAFPCPRLCITDLLCDTQHLPIDTASQCSDNRWVSLLCITVHHCLCVANQADEPAADRASGELRDESEGEEELQLGRKPKKGKKKKSKSSISFDLLDEDENEEVAAPDGENRLVCENRLVYRGRSIRVCMRTAGVQGRRLTWLVACLAAGCVAWVRMSLHFEVLASLNPCGRCGSASGQRQLRRFAGGRQRGRGAPAGAQAQEGQKEEEVQEGHQLRPSGRGRGGAHMLCLVQQNLNNSTWPIAQLHAVATCLQLRRIYLLCCTVLMQ